MKKKYWILLILLLTVLAGGGYMVFKQHTEKEKMIAIAHSEEARVVYEDYIKKSVDESFNKKKEFVKSYTIDNSTLDYNPMGGLMVTLVINDDNDLTIGFNLMDNGDGTYHSAYYVESPKLADITDQNE
ncbi:DUF1310 domain-containing protein [Streptococcus uberis]|uniref:DUF1310 family protein n=1 Tax=Streptococcus uberis TaxID=1349 RepID=UPI001FF2D6F4|nr:DUF1310 family protein [Streptococcus uberis]MCK1191240.1 DUF1310 domain-containing protein [Streptococcus uberis]